MRPDRRTRVSRGAAAACSMAWCSRAASGASAAPKGEYIGADVERYFDTVGDPRTSSAPDTSRITALLSRRSEHGVRSRPRAHRRAGRGARPRPDLRALRRACRSITAIVRDDDLRVPTCWRSCRASVFIDRHPPEKMQGRRSIYDEIRGNTVARERELRVPARRVGTLQLELGHFAVHGLAGERQVPRAVDRGARQLLRRPLDNGSSTSCASCRSTNRSAITSARRIFRSLFRDPKASVSCRASAPPTIRSSVRIAGALDAGSRPILRLGGARCRATIAAVRPSAHDGHGA